MSGKKIIQIQKQLGREKEPSRAVTFLISAG